MTLYANKKRDRKPTLKKRNKAYLLRRNIKTKRSSNKLNHTKLESYKILEIKESINYKLDLSTSMKIHSIFHICLLKSADSNTLIQTESSEIDSESQNIEYEVENILNQQNIKDQSHWINQVKRLWTYQEHLKIKEKSQELSDAFVTVSVEKFSQSKFDESSICSKNISKKRLFSDDSLVFLSFFSSSTMFQNFRSIINCFLFFRNINWFCRRVVLAKISCICLWAFSSSSRTRSHSAFILFHFIIEKVRLHLRLRCTHSMQWLNSLSTRHFFCKRLQCSQKRMTARSELVRSRKSLQRKVKFLIVQWEDMKKKWFSRRKS